MPTVKEALEILGLGIDADEAAIKKAYRMLAHEWHPDKNPTRVDEAGRRMKMINAAYAALKGYKPPVACNERRQNGPGRGSAPGGAGTGPEERQDGEGADSRQAAHENAREAHEEQARREASERIKAERQARAREERRRHEEAQRMAREQQAAYERAKAEQDAREREDSAGNERVYETPRRGAGRHPGGIGMRGAGMAAPDRTPSPSIGQIISNGFKSWLARHIGQIIHFSMQAGGAFALVLLLFAGMKACTAYVQKSGPSPIHGSDSSASDPRADESDDGADGGNSSEQDAGKSYGQAVRAVWMERDLDITTYRNGDEILHAESDDEWKDACKRGVGAWCRFGNEPGAGVLYNRFAVNDPRGIAPEGWHIPGEAEWDDAINVNRITLFTSSPGGLRKSNAGFSRRGRVAYYWIARNGSGNRSVAFDLDNLDFTKEGKVIRNTGEGYSLRLVKDN